MGFKQKRAFSKGKKCSFVCSFLPPWTPFVTFNFITFFLNLELPSKCYTTRILSKMSLFTISESYYNMTTHSISLHMNILFLGHVTHIIILILSFIIFNILYTDVIPLTRFEKICNRCGIFQKNVEISTLSLPPFFR